ncbi:hypothetical protein E1A91_D04G146600v1 [Gossypium mustelinum]|uniref:Uncharacterized protein n=1 Tax=Gossypium mustelinum TaxID=34275 RepID=A0A5D2VDZ1_GOSMU|nr:hypothetical protein E1A91_D04G146600v1 [Gossypium mustelinum]
MKLKKTHLQTTDRMTVNSNKLKAQRQYLTVTRTDNSQSNNRKVITSERNNSPRLSEYISLRFIQQAKAKKISSLKPSVIITLSLMKLLSWAQPKHESLNS